MRPEAAPRLNIVGLGIRIPDHITVEVSRTLATCTRIFTVVQEPPAAWLPAEGAHVPVINLMEMYEEGAIRTQNYERVSNRIFQSLDDTAVVGYVTYGNPLVYDSVSQQLVRHARQAGVRFNVLAGISSIDTLLCDLGVDMAPGIQVYEASWLVAGQVPLVVTAPAILLQLGTFGSFRTHYRDRINVSSLEPLVSYLSRSYPRSHPVHLVRSGDREQPANLRNVPLGDLTTVDTDDVLGASMYIPCLQPAQLDQGIVAMMERT
jgi:uncharacterized protein YabN with tetrapyrrole methylase and pyrophosphatase domain